MKLEARKKKWIETSEKLFPELFDYSKVEYINKQTKVMIGCKSCNKDFLITPDYMISRPCELIVGCYECNLNRRSKNMSLDKSEIIERYKEHWTFTNWDGYKTSNDFVTAKCNKCDYISKFKIRRLMNNRGCSKCTLKTEKQMLKYLEKNGFKVETQFIIESCKNKKYLPFDFCIPDKKIIIELDGMQHFKQVRNWKCPKEQLLRDIFKMKKAFENGYKIIRIFQEDVYRYKDEWLNSVLLPEISDGCKQFMFISKNKDIYNEHIKFIGLDTIY